MLKSESGMIKPFFLRRMADKTHVYYEQDFDSMTARLFPEHFSGPTPELDGVEWEVDQECPTFKCH